MIIVYCPTCNSSIHESEYNLSTQLAQCESCESVFTFDTKQAILADKSYKDIEKPNNIKISTFPNGGQIIIHHKSLRLLIPGFIIGLLFIVIFIFFILPSLSRHNSSFEIVIPILIPLFIIYLGINEFLKKTTVVIKNDILSIITKSPISLKNTSWRSNKNNINQIFVKKRIVESDDSSTIYFDLGVETKNKKIHFPIKNFHNRQELYFVEVELEKLFGIKDKHHDQEVGNLSILPQNFTEMKTVARELYKSYKKGN